MGRTTTRAWRRLRDEVWVRDHGICWVCGGAVHPSEYELGHLVDVFVGGSNFPENVVVMHRFCNNTKPLHETRAEAEGYRSSTIALDEVVDRMLADEQGVEAARAINADDPDLVLAAARTGSLLPVEIARRVTERLVWRTPAP